MSNLTPPQTQADAPAIAQPQPAWPWLIAGWFCAAVLLVPWSPDMPGEFPDGEWEWAINDAWLRGSVWGRDIMFTYGPWGMLGRAMYNPRTFSLLIVFGLVLSFTYAALFWRVFGQTCQRGWRWLGALLVILVLTPSIETTVFTLIFLFGLLCWKIEHDHSQRAGEKPDQRAANDLRSDHAVQFGAALLLSLISHTKETWGMVSLAVLLIFAINHAINRRRVYWPLLIFLSGTIVFWLLAGQPLSAIPAYLGLSIATISNYTEALCFPGPMIQIGLFVVCAALVLAGAAARLWHRRREAGAALFLAMLIQWLVVFKATFVRHDGGHATIGAWIALEWSALYLLWIAPERRLKPAILFVCTLAVAFALMYQTARVFPIVTPLDQLRSAPKRLADMMRLTAGRADLERQWRERIAQAAAKYPLPPIPGTVDIYPNTILAPMAHRFNYTPRPALQAYQATSPAVVALDDAYLVSPRAPQFLILEVTSFDWCLPTVHDSLSWPRFLELYGVAGRSAQRLVLERSTQPRLWRSTQIEKRRVAFDEKVDLPPLPPGSYYWAEVDLKKSLAGAVAASLFRIPMLGLHYKTADGGASDYRIIRQLAHGVLIGPMLLDADDYVRLSAGDAALPSRSPVSVTLKAFGRASPYWAYDHDYELTLWRRDPLPTPGTPRTPGPTTTQP